MPEKLRAAPVQLGHDLKVSGNPKKQKLQEVEERRCCNLQLRGRSAQTELKRDDSISKGILAPLSFTVLIQEWSRSWVNLHTQEDAHPGSVLVSPLCKGVRNSSLPKLCPTSPPVPPTPPNHQSSG